MVQEVLELLAVLGERPSGLREQIVQKFLRRPPGGALVEALLDVDADDFRDGEGILARRVPVSSARGPFPTVPARSRAAAWRVPLRGGDTSASRHRAHQRAPSPPATYAAHKPSVGNGDRAVNIADVLGGRGCGDVGVEPERRDGKRQQRQVLKRESVRCGHGRSLPARRQTPWRPSGSVRSEISSVLGNVHRLLRSRDLKNCISGGT